MYVFSLLKCKRFPSEGGHGALQNTDPDVRYRESRVCGHLYIPGI